MKRKYSAKSRCAQCMLIALTSLPLASHVIAQSPGVFSKLNVGNATGTISGDGTIVAEGKYGTSSPLAAAYQTEGARMLWYPRKAAFRAGYGTATNWNEATIGNFSTAMGSTNNASGTQSVAIGGYNTASGIASTALGSSNVASGIASTALGSSNVSSGNYSSAMGVFSNAIGQSSTTMGSSNSAIGDYSTAMGIGTVATSYASTAIGCYNMGGGFATHWNSSDPIFEIGNGTVNYEYAEPEIITSNALTVYKNGNMQLQGNLTLGGTITSAGNPVLTETAALSAGFVRDSEVWPQVDPQLRSNSVSLSDGNASGPLSTAMSGGNSSGQYSMASGTNATASSYSSVSFGRYNRTWGSPDQWIENEPLLLIGNGTSSDAAGVSNALAVLKNGQTTLTNKAWSQRDTATVSATADPDPNTIADSDGNALVVDGHTVLNGKVIISVPQGDISMGIYGE